MSELLLQSLFSGVLAGGYYALIALGLSVVFGTTRVINLAHGEMVLLSAYLAYMAETRFGLDPLASIPLAIAVVCATAIVVYAVVARLRRDRELNSLILTFGIGIILTNLILMIWSPDIRSTKTPWFNDAVLIGDMLYSTNSQLLFFVIGLLLAGALWLWLSRSWYGRAIRAVASNRDAAMLVGVNPRVTEIMSFAAAGVLASVAGTALYTAGVIQPALGHALTIKAFVITVLAGLGSVPGVVIAAMLIGIAEALTVTLASSALQELAGMILFLLVLFLRPSGLFGRAARAG